MRKVFTLLSLIVAFVSFNAKADCYMVGEVNGNGWSPQVGVQLPQTSTTGVYSGEIEVTGSGYFGVADMLLSNDDWGYFNANCRYNASSKDLAVTLDTEMPMTKGGSDNSWKATPGRYTATVNFNNKTLKLTSLGGGGTVTPANHTFCMVGSHASLGWDLNAAPQLTNNGDNTWSISLSDLSGEFQIVRNKDWNQSCRSNGEAITPGVAYVPMFGNGGEDSNIKLGEGVSYNNVTITVTETGTNAYSILMTADGQGTIDPVISTYTLVGEINNWTNDASAPTFVSQGDGVYTLSLDELSGQFLILRDMTWTKACRSNGSTLIPDVPYTPAFGDGGEDSNLSLPLGFIYKGVEITLTYVGTDSYTILVTAESTEETEMPADTFTLVGTTTGWDFSAAPQFNYMGDKTWTLYLEELSGEFKAVRNNDWAQALNSNGSTFTADALYTPFFGQGGEDSNIKLPELTLYKGVNITITETSANNYTIYMTAESSETITPPADTFAIVGEFNNWDIYAAPQFTYNGDDTWSISLDQLYGQFLLVRNGEWNQALRSNGSGIELGTPYSPAFGDGGEDSNIALPADKTYIGVDITITKTGTDSYTILINAEKEVGDDEAIYELTGDFNDWELGTAYFTKTAEGVYTLSLDEFSGSGFKVIKNGSFEQQYGANYTAEVFSEGIVYYLSPLGSDAEIIYTDGKTYTNVTFTLTIDEEEMATILMTGTVGIEGIEAEQEAEYFNLQGIRVSNPTKGELYIVRKGNKIIKSILK